MTFDQVLTVTGAPQLAIAVGTTTRQAAGSHTSGESKIAFSYTVATADRDADCIAVAAGALTLNGATVRNARGEDARLGLGSHALAAQTGHKVSTPPRVADVVVMKPDLRVGNDGESPFVALSSVDRDPRQTATNRFPPSIALVNVVFDQPVTISGNAAARTHHRRSYPPGDVLRRFQRQPRRGAVLLQACRRPDFDGDGISVVANALALNGGTIRDARGRERRARPRLPRRRQRRDLAGGGRGALLRGDAGGAALPAEPAGERPAPAATGGDGALTYSLSPALPRRPLLERRHAHDLRHAPEPRRRRPPTRCRHRTATATRRR